MKRLSHEQKRIEQLQSVMNTRPQSRSTPRSKSSSVDHGLDSSTTTKSNSLVSERTEPDTITDATLRLSELDTLPADADTTRVLASEDQPSSTNRGIQEVESKFSHPNTHSMSQSTDEPFILHDSSKTSKGSDKQRKSKVSQSEDSTRANSPKTTNRNSGMVRSSSNGFLSSSQLSKRKVSLLTCYYTCMC